MKTTKLFALSGLLLGLLLLVATGAGPDTKSSRTTFEVRIENIADAGGQLASDGTRWPFALSPGLYIVHTKKAVLFKAGKKDAGMGLEAQAEDGNPEVLLASLVSRPGVQTGGLFNTPVGAEAPGPATPGAVFTFTFEAEPGDRLSFVTMFGQSNDLFYAPDDKGLPLFDKGQPLSGDLTAKLLLWDAGTEVNQEPGIGPDQAPRQMAPNTGASEQDKVRRVRDGFAYPKTTNVLRIIITPMEQGTL